MRIALTLEDGLTLMLKGADYLRYQMKYGLRDDVLACECDPVFVLEAEYSPTKSEVRTAHIGLCMRRGTGALFEGRDIEHVNVIALTDSSAAALGTVEEGKSAIFSALGAARLIERDA